MTNMSVSLPDQMKAWIEGRIRTGQYNNASEYLRDLIRRDQEVQQKLHTLRAAIAEGYDSGISEKTVGDVWREAKARSGNAV
jgi:antitoxin ParD1/3/4